MEMVTNKEIYTPTIQFNEIDAQELNGLGSFALGVGAGIATVGVVAGGIVLLTWENRRSSGELFLDKSYNWIFFGTMYNVYCYDV